MTTLGLTPASKPMRSSAPLAGQQFHIFHICQTWHHLTSICLDPLKFEGQHFSSDEVKTAVRKWLKMQPVEFYNKGIFALIKRWEKAVQKAGDYIEK